MAKVTMRQIACTPSEQDAEGTQGALLLTRLILRPQALRGASGQMGQVAVQGQVRQTRFVIFTGRGGRTTKAAPRTAHMAILVDLFMLQMKSITRRG